MVACAIIACVLASGEYDMYRPTHSLRELAWGLIPTLSRNLQLSREYKALLADGRLPSDEAQRRWADRSERFAIDMFRQLDLPVPSDQELQQYASDPRKPFRTRAEREETMRLLEEHRKECRRRFNLPLRK